jgi:hypothetical protein
MNYVRRTLKPASYLMIAMMLILSTPHQALWAAMVDTETVLSAERIAQTRQALAEHLARPQVREQLQKMGIDPKEAQARIDNLSDAEIARIADRLDELPAGGDALGIVLGLIVLAFVVLIITDIVGVTDIFTFIKKHDRSNINKSDTSDINESDTSDMGRPDLSIDK